MARRYHALDGLRGIAALIVLINHALLSSSTGLAGVFRTPPEEAKGIDAAFVYSPLHVLWDGTTAVFVFFVLSGFVLTLPFIDGAGWRAWLVYYPRRLIRLFVPVWGALAVALTLFLLIPRRADPGATWWLNMHDEPLSFSGAIRDSTLVFGNTSLDAPLWSLRWELAFSILLPAFLLFGLKWRRAGPLKLLVLLAMTFASGVTNTNELLFLPQFALGVLVAVHRHQLIARTVRLTRTAWWALSLATVMLLSAGWLSQAITLDSFATGVARGLQSLGACAVVLLFLCWPPLSAVGSARAVQWLGARSFSLYLIHEPITVSLALLLGPGTHPLVMVALAVAIALPLTSVFYRFVERPSHRLSRFVGGSVEAGIAAQAFIRTRQSR